MIAKRQVEELAVRAAQDFDAAVHSAAGEEPHPSRKAAIWRGTTRSSSESRCWASAGSRSTSPAFLATARIPYDGETSGPVPPVRVSIRAPKAIPRMVIEVVDDHGAPIATTTRAIPAGVRVKLVLKTPRGAQGFRVRVGEWMEGDMVTSMSRDLHVSSGALESEPSDWELDK